jgi:hypothetical protein
MRHHGARSPVSAGTGPVPSRGAGGERGWRGLGGARGARKPPRPAQAAQARHPRGRPQAGALARAITPAARRSAPRSVPAPALADPVPDNPIVLPVEGMVQTGDSNPRQPKSPSVLYP